MGVSHHPASGLVLSPRAMATERDEAMPNDNDRPYRVEPVPYPLMIRLDQALGGRYIVTNVGSCQSHALPTGRWELEFDDGCELAPPMLYGIDEEGEPLGADIDDIFPETVYADDRGYKYLCRFDSATGDMLKCTTMEHQEIRNQEGVLNIDLQSAGATLEIRAYDFKIPRFANQRLFIAIPDLHMVLKISGYDGKVSKWWCAKKNLSHRKSRSTSEIL